MSGVGDRIDPRTGQLRTQIHEDIKAIFDILSIDPGQEGFTGPLEIYADKDITLFIKTAQNFQVSVQLTNEGSSNPNWYDLCDATGAAITFTVNATTKAIPVSCKAERMRLRLKNNGTAADTPIAEVR